MMFKKIIMLICVLYSINIYCQTTTGEWIVKTDMPTARTQAYAVTAGNKIYVIGGDNSGAVEVYTPSKNTWEKKKSFPGDQLNCSGAGLIGDDIYAVICIGSRDNTKYHVIAKYNIRKDEWTRIDSTSTPVNDPGIAITGKSIYIISGFMEGKNTINGNIPLTNIDTVKEYNLVTGKWSIKAKIPTRRHTPWVTVIDSLIYVFGGVDETFSTPPCKVVEVYDPKNNSWTSKNKMRDGMAYFRGARIGNRIYFSDGRIKSIAVYDIYKDSWSNESAIPYNGVHCAFAALNNVIYLFGGATYTNNKETYIKNTYAYIPKGMVKDIDGNVYDTIKIGKQTWLNENLKTNHYTDGTQIIGVKNNTNDSISCIYGKFYTWDAATRNSSGQQVQGASPTGWHIPTDEEWTELENYLGGSDAAGGKLKEAGFDHWKSPNEGATNESGFTALPGGFFADEGVTFSLGDAANIWTATQVNSGSAFIKIIGYNDSKITKAAESKSSAFSVRCIKDTVASTSDAGEALKNTKLSFSLPQNYPNPFNPETVIKYSLSAESHVELKVFDTLGHVVTTLVNKKQQPGNYQIKFDGKKLSSGIYFYKITAGNFIKTNKMILIR